MSDAPITVTIKHGKGYDDPWIVFKGSHDDVRREVVDTYALSVSDSLSLAEVVHNAKQVAASLGATKALGTKVEKVEKTTSKPKEEPRAEEPQEDPEEALAKAFSEAQSKEELRTLWKDNAALCKGSTALRDAYVARGKALNS